MHFLFGHSLCKYILINTQKRNTLICQKCVILLQEICAGEILNVFRSLIRMFGWINGFYFLCDYGNQVTENFQNISDSMYDCPWYAMPLNLAKQFSKMIATAQKPIFLCGFINIQCTCIKFRKVNQKTFSFSHTFLLEIYISFFFF